jgi:hypothetical protein
MKASIEKLIDKESKAAAAGFISEITLETVLNAIESAQQDMSISAIQLHRLVEPEDPNWEELVFEVIVDAAAEDAFKFWDRIGSQLEKIMDKSQATTKQELEELVSVHVLWR